MSPRILLRIVPFTALVLAGCGGSAVLVSRTENGGVLAIDGEHVEAMADARRQMSEHCGGAYSIVEQRRAVTGVYHDREITEYLVQYVCGEQLDKPALPASSGAPATSPR
ncbi:Hypothetical protein A7982_04166 [Minicystis rosea]|nr:Hypothetical protein A7982_04166 [Minicystis rosea]